MVRICPSATVYITNRTQACAVRFRWLFSLITLCWHSKQAKPRCLETTTINNVMWLLNVIYILKQNLPILVTAVAISTVIHIPRSRVHETHPLVATRGVGLLGKCQLLGLGVHLIQRIVRIWDCESTGFVSLRYLCADDAYCHLFITFTWCSSIPALPQTPPDSFPPVTSSLCPEISSTVSDAYS